MNSLTTLATDLFENLDKPSNAKKPHPPSTLINSPSYWSHNFSTRDQCEELRSIQSKRNQDQVCHERNEQILLKEEERKRQEETEKMYADLWASDRVAKSEREEQEEKNLIERNRECLKVCG